MAIQLGALRDALIGAGAKPAAAEKASEEVAAYSRVSSLESRLRVLTWLAGVNAAMVLLVLVKLFAADGGGSRSHNCGPWVSCGRRTSG
jgi:hypothetical protein